VFDASVKDPTGRDIFTWSRVTATQTCPRKGYLRYGLGWRREGTPGKALRIGLAYHEAQHACVTGDVDRVPEIMAEHVGDEFEHEYVLAMLASYWERYEREPYEFVASELQFEIELHGKRAAGAIDGIVRVSDGRLMVLERKTTSDDITPGESYWWAVRINEQVSLYMIAARALGYDVAGVIWEAVRKPGQRPLKSVNESAEQYGERVAHVMGSDPGRYFQRVELVRTEAQLEAFALDFARLCQSAAEVSGLPRSLSPRNTTQCNISGRRCPFLDICDRDWTLLDDAPAGYEQLSWIHTELEAPTEVEQ